jgi:uncharacterized membrane protein HdeD (DUF308 family)
LTSHPGHGRGALALGPHWLVFVVLGLSLILMGAIALGWFVVASLATAIAVGVVMLVGGVIETVAAVWARSWSGFFLHLASGVLGIIVGILFLRAPLGVMLALTLLLACLLMAGGILRVIGAVGYRFEGRGWTLAVGVIDLILGVLIWMEWPAAALCVLGLYVGISLVIH